MHAARLGRHLHILDCPDYQYLEATRYRRLPFSALDAYRGLSLSPAAFGHSTRLLELYHYW